MIFFFNLPWIPRAEALPVPNFQVRNEHDKTESIRRSAMETEYFSSELISSLDIYMREKKPHAPVQNLATPKQEL